MNGKRRILALGLLAAASASAQQSFDPDYAAGAATPLVGAEPYAFVDYEKGEGVPIVFLGAPVVDQRYWQLQIEPFSERYRAVALGGGRGASSTPDEIIAALEALREKLGVQRINLVAHSMGARISMELAIARPDLFDALVLEEPAWAPTPDMTEPLPSPPRQECGLEDLVPVDLETCLFFSMQMGPGRFEAMPDAMRGYFLEAWRRAADFLAETGQEDSEWQPRAICKELGELDLPILVVRGEETPAFFQAGLDYYERCLPSHETAFIPRGTHMAHFENPVAYNRAVMAFFDRIAKR